MSVDDEKEDVSLRGLLSKAAKDENGDTWEAVKSKLQELENEPENDECFGEVDEILGFLMPPKILEIFMRVLCKSTNHFGELPPILQKICKNVGGEGRSRLTFEHVQVAFEGSTEKEILVMDVVYPDERYERNQSALMLLLDNNLEHLALEHLKSAHLLATKCPALLHVESFGDCAGEHFQGTLHPMKEIPKLVEQVLNVTLDDDLAVGYISNYWFPVHSIWCDKLGIPDSVGDRFLRMLFDLVTAHVDELLEFMCEKTMWNIPTTEITAVWKGILKSGILGENQVVLDKVIPMLGVTPEFIIFARERKRSVNVINALIKSNPGACAEAAAEVKEPSKKRVKTGSNK